MDRTTPMAALEDQEAEARRALARHRALATGLLVLMAALTLVTYAMPPGYGTDLLQAAAELQLVAAALPVADRHL